METLRTYYWHFQNASTINLKMKIVSNRAVTVCRNVAKSQATKEARIRDVIHRQNPGDNLRIHDMVCNSSQANPSHTTKQILIGIGKKIQNELLLIFI